MNGLTSAVPVMTDYGLIEYGPCIENSKSFVPCPRNWGSDQPHVTARETRTTRGRGRYEHFVTTPTHIPDVGLAPSQGATLFVSPIVSRTAAPPPRQRSPR